jgi:Tol biopolymer transport system component
MVNHSGTELASSIGKDYSAPRISPDGEKVAVRIHDGIKADIYLYSFRDGTLTRLTYEGDNGYPTWTHDGQRIAFYSNREGTIGLFWKKADGSSDAERIHFVEHPQHEVSFSHDGKFLVYRTAHRDTGGDLWILPLDGENKPQPYLVSPHYEIMPMISPDDRFIAYVSNESGENEVYVSGLPNHEGVRMQVSENGGVEPLWSKDGKKLFYRNSRSEIVSVEVETSPVFRKGKSEVLFEDTFIKRINHQNYDIHPINQQFLMLKNIGSSGIIVVLNWTEELKRLFPTEK